MIYHCLVKWFRLTMVWFSGRVFSRCNFPVAAVGCMIIMSAMITTGGHLFVHEEACYRPLCLAGSRIGRLKAVNSGSLCGQATRRANKKGAPKVLE